MDGGTLVLAALVGAVVVSAVVWASLGDNVDTEFSGCLWTLVLVATVVGMIWAFGAWVVDG